MTYLAFVLNLDSWPVKAAVFWFLSSISSLICALLLVLSFGGLTASSLTMIFDL